MIRLLAMMLALCAAAPAQATCRQALALGLDVSGSVDAAEHSLQMRGLANALLHPDVRAALLDMPQAPVMLAVYEWSGPQDQRLVVPWTAIDSTDALHALAQRLTDAPRMAGEPSTAIGAAMRFGALLLAQQPQCWRRTLDISGDGKSNTGPRPHMIRQEMIDQAITVNGLVIGVIDNRGDDHRQLHAAELTAYFRANVLTGPDAFVETALGFMDFEAAMVRKLLRELQSPVFGGLPTATQARHDPQ